MYIYIISFLITILLIYIAKTKVKNKKIKVILLILAVIPMLLVSALRYQVGTDYTKRYVENYRMLQKGIDVEDLEIGFKAIDYVCLFFTKDAYLLFIVTSLIILSIVLKLYIKNHQIRF